MVWKTRRSGNDPTLFPSSLSFEPFRGAPRCLRGERRAERRPRRPSERSAARAPRRGAPKRGVGPSPCLDRLWRNWAPHAVGAGVRRARRALRARTAQHHTGQKRSTTFSLKFLHPAKISTPRSPPPPPASPLGCPADTGSESLAAARTPLTVDSRPCRPQSQSSCSKQTA